jgi:hypothetical protein
MHNHYEFASPNSLQCPLPTRPTAPDLEIGAGPYIFSGSAATERRSHAEKGVGRKVASS